MAGAPPPVARGFGSITRGGRRNAAKAFTETKSGASQKSSERGAPSRAKRLAGVSQAPSGNRLAEARANKRVDSASDDGTDTQPRRTRASGTAIPMLDNLIPIEGNSRQRSCSRQTLNEIISLLEQNGSNEASAASVILSDMTALLEFVDYKRQHVVSARPRKSHLPETREAS